MEHCQIPTNGIKLHVVQDGPISGPLVILLHGFPEFWYGWRRQIPYLAEAGYRVWAPDQRGYNLSDKPGDKRDYTLDKLADDILGLIQASGRERVYLVGHDWGGTVAWWVAAKYPERLHKLAILNVPHGSVLDDQMRRNLAQMRRSSYILAFQIPWLPETVIQIGDWRLAVKALKDTSRPGTFTEQDLGRYREAWSQQDAFHSMLNWYRAIIQHPPRNAPPRLIKVPTLLIWGRQDRFFEPDLARISINTCQQGELVFIDEATHWVQHEEPARVNQLLSSFLS